MPLPGRHSVLDHLLTRTSCCQLACSGPAVGLPVGTMGNSEVGHMNIGAGRRVLQDLIRINAAIEDRTLFDNPVLTAAMDTLKQKGKALHLMGLLSDGGVHSHISHTLALVDMARIRGVKTVYIHAIWTAETLRPKRHYLYEPARPAPGSIRVRPGQNHYRPILDNGPGYPVGPRSKRV